MSMRTHVVTLRRSAARFFDNPCRYSSIKSTLFTIQSISLCLFAGPRVGIGVIRFCTAFGRGGPIALSEETIAMKKTFFALAAAATIGVTAIAAPTDAFAQRRGGAFAAGIIGGAAARAPICGAPAAHPRPPAHAPPPRHLGYPGYAAGG